MIALPDEVLATIYEMANTYKDQFAPVLHQIRMIRLRKDILSCMDHAHTCYTSKGCSMVVRWWKDYNMPSQRSECCEFIDYRRHKQGVAWKWMVRATNGATLCCSVYG